MINKNKIIPILLVIAVAVFLAGCVENGTTDIKDIKNSTSKSTSEGSKISENSKIESNVESNITEDILESDTGDSGTDSGTDDTETSETNKTNVSLNLSSTNESKTIKSASWCSPGATVALNGREYTVKGIVKTLNNKEICEADITGQDQKIVHLFSEDRSIDSESAVSTGRNAKSEAVSIAQGTGNNTSGKSASGGIK